MHQAASYFTTSTAMYFCGKRILPGKRMRRTDRNHWSLAVRPPRYLLFHDDVHFAINDL